MDEKSGIGRFGETGMYRRQDTPVFAGGREKAGAKYGSIQNADIISFFCPH